MRDALAKIDEIADKRRAQLFQQWQTSIGSNEREALYYQVEALNIVINQLKEDLKPKGS
jgi:hypothetical protein